VGVALTCAAPRQRPGAAGCPAIKGVTSCSNVVTAGSCRYYLPSQTIRGNSKIGETCGHWCKVHGLSCTGMFDDSGNSCNHKSNHEKCDFRGDSGDVDWICECKNSGEQTPALVCAHARASRVGSG